MNNANLYSLNSFCGPVLAPFQDSDWDAITQTMKSGLRLRLKQAWRARPEPGFAPGWVRLGIHDRHLLLHATLRDVRPHNEIKSRNQDTLSGGDVLELFLQKKDGIDYYEFHLTPENQRLQLHFPDSRALKSGVPLKTWMVEEDLFESFTRIHPSLTRWQVFIRVDLVALFGSLPTELRFLVGRYDAQPGIDRPVISSSGSLSECDFHRIAEWSCCRIIQGRNSNSSR
jgi:hypothetical protein